MLEMSTLTSVRRNSQDTDGCHGMRIGQLSTKA